MTHSATGFPLIIGLHCNFHGALVFDGNSPSEREHSPVVDTLTMWIESLMSTAWVYPVIGALIFGDSFIPVLPSEIPLNLVGAWSGARGEPNIGLMFIVAVMCAVVGDNLCFLLGTRLMPYVNRIRDRKSTRLNSSHVAISY